MRVKFAASILAMVEVLTDESQPQTIQSNAIVAQGLSKTYRTGFWLNQKISSLQDFSLTIRKGETFGVLGPNGAGKTTLLKILLGIVKPTSGTGKF